MRKELLRRYTTILSPFLSIAFLIHLSRHAFPAESRHYIRSRDYECDECGSAEDLQVHHRCFQSVAKELGIDYCLYQHPSNGVAKCPDCHHNLHDRQKNLSKDQKITMVIELLERIIEYHHNRVNDPVLLHTLFMNGILLEESEGAYHLAKSELIRIKKMRSKRRASLLAAD